MTPSELDLANIADALAVGVEGSATKRSDTTPRAALELVGVCDSNSPRRIRETVCSFSASRVRATPTAVA
jgi:hypothetical protein